VKSAGFPIPATGSRQNPSCLPQHTACVAIDTAREYWQDNVAPQLILFRALPAAR